MAPKKYFNIYRFLFIFKISPKGHRVILFLSFDNFFKNNVNNLKHNGIDDPWDNPMMTPLILDDPLR
jgi:hypothetical protein